MTWRLPSGEDFEFLKKELQKMEFRIITRTEFKKTFTRLGLQAPRPKLGREIGFTFMANDLKVVVWTTFIDQAEPQAREQDCGWVLISDAKKALYFSHPMRRTEGFIKKLINYAWIARFRVVHRPLCPVCSRYMDIASGKNFKSRYWKCVHTTKHIDPVYLQWDYQLTKKAKDFLKKERLARTRYVNERKRQGKSVNEAILKRKRWKIAKPENL